MVSLTLKVTIDESGNYKLWTECDGEISDNTDADEAQCSYDVTLNFPDTRARQATVDFPATPDNKPATVTFE